MGGLPQRQLPKRAAEQLAPQQTQCAAASQSYRAKQFSDSLRGTSGVCQGFMAFVGESWASLGRIRNEGTLQTSGARHTATPRAPLKAVDSQGRRLMRLRPDATAQRTCKRAALGAARLNVANDVLPDKSTGCHQANSQPYGRRPYWLGARR